MKLAGILAGIPGVDGLKSGGFMLSRSVYYWNLQSPPEGLNGAVNILNDLGVEFIWYAHWVVGFPMPPDFEQAGEIARNCGLGRKSENFVEWCEREFYSLECIRKQVNAVQGKIYCPAILGYTNFRADFNFDPLTFEPIDREELENWLLDLGKWDLKNPKTKKPFTIEDTQEIFRKMGLPKERAIPDFSNSDVMRYYIRKAMALKKVGVKAVWYDTFFQLPLGIKRYLNLSFDHPAVRELYEGCLKIVKGARALGLTTGTWNLCFNFPYRKVPEVDFVTASPTSEEVLKLKLDKEKWRRVESKILSKRQKTWLLIMLDFANRDDLPLAIFSQKLTSEEQRHFLKILHDLSLRLSVNSAVAYPVHGLGTGTHPKKLAWGRYRLYDAKAPEFRTYQTIAELMNSRKIPISPVLPVASLLLALVLKLLLSNLSNRPKNYKLN